LVRSSTAVTRADAATSRTELYGLLSEHIEQALRKGKNSFPRLILAALILPPEKNGKKEVKFKMHVLPETYSKHGRYEKCMQSFGTNM